MALSIYVCVSTRLAQVVTWNGGVCAIQRRAARSAVINKDFHFDRLRIPSSTGRSPAQVEPLLQRYRRPSLNLAARNNWCCRQPRFAVWCRYDRLPVLGW